MKIAEPLRTRLLTLITWKVDWQCAVEKTAAHRHAWRQQL